MAAGYRKTVQRAMILDVVRAADSHLTAGEIFERVRQRDPRIAYGTVYRTLHLLAQHGEIQELTFADQAGRRQIDEKALRAKHPDIAALFETEPERVRVMRHRVRR